jgi:hypothetical protein
VAFERTATDVVILPVKNVLVLWDCKKGRDRHVATELDGHGPVMMTLYQSELRCKRACSTHGQKTSRKRRLESRRRWRCVFGRIVLGSKTIVEPPKRRELIAQRQSVTSQKF